MNVLLLLSMFCSLRLLAAVNVVRKIGEPPENWVGYTYQWDGDDAVLVDGRRNYEKFAAVSDETAELGLRTRSYLDVNSLTAITLPNLRHAVYRDVASR